MMEVSIIQKPVRWFASANQWTDFYMLITSVMNELNNQGKHILQPSKLFTWQYHKDKKWTSCYVNVVDTLTLLFVNIFFIDITRSPLEIASLLLCMLHCLFSCTLRWCELVKSSVKDIFFQPFWPTILPTTQITRASSTLHQRTFPQNSSFS